MISHHTHPNDGHFTDTSSSCFTGVVLFLAFLLLILFPNGGSATPYVDPEEMTITGGTAVEGPVERPELPPMGELDEYFYLYEYMQVLDWLTVMQELQPGPEYGGQHEGEEDWEIIQTDNTQEAIRDWSHYAGITGDAARYQANIDAAWEYTMNHPAYDEEGGGNPNYYRVHNSGWGLVAVMEYTEAYDDDTYLWYGDSCAAYIDTYRLAWGNEFQVNPLAAAYGAGTLYLYGQWRGNEQWTNAAREIAESVKSWIETNPNRLTQETWAMSGGTAMWGVVTALFLDDHETAEEWLPPYMEVMDVYSGRGNWNNSWTIWYGHAWNAIHAVLGDEPSAENANWTVDFLLDQDEIDDDGGVPGTEGQYENDQSWTSAYLVWYGLEKLFPEDAFSPDGALGEAVIPTPEFPLLTGVPVTFHVEVFNNGLLPMTGVQVQAGDGEIIASAEVDLEIGARTMVELQPPWTPENDGDITIEFSLLHPADIDSSNNFLAVEYSVEQSVLVIGQVTDAGSGEGVQSVLNFYLDDINENEPVIQAFTTENGDYETHLAAGEYRLELLPQVAPYTLRTFDPFVVPEEEEFEADLGLSPARVLYVSEMENDAYDPFILDALANIDVDTYFWKVSERGEPEEAILSGASTLLWATGAEEENILDPVNYEPLFQFLEEGGSALLTGQNIVNWWGDEELLGDYFGVQPGVLDLNHPRMLHGGENQAILAGEELLIFGAGGAGNQVSPDAVLPAEDAESVLYYDDNEEQVAAVSYQHPEFGYRTLFCSFGVEAINSNAPAFMSREEFLAAVLDYFDNIGQGGELIVPLQGNYFELISTCYQPANLDAADVFGAVTHLEIVYQDDGGIFIPPAINTIGDMDIREGYEVFCSDASQIVFAGEPVPAGTVFELASGRWNWLAYPLAVPLSIETALAEIEDAVEIVLADDGRLWIPSVPLNTIGEMQCGEGYNVFLNQGVTFEYPQPDFLMQSVNTGEPAAFGESPQIRPTGHPYVILVDLPEHETRAAELRIYDGDLCVGASGIDRGSGVQPVIAWEGDPERNLPGFRTGNSIWLRALDDRGNLLYEEESGHFGEAPFTTISLETNPAALPEKFSVSPVYPNPFNPEMVVPVSLPRKGLLGVEVVNLLGQVVFQDSKLMEAGEHEISIRSNGLSGEWSSGLYLVRIHYNRQVRTLKAMLIR